MQKQKWLWALFVFFFMIQEVPAQTRKNNRTAAKKQTRKTPAPPATAPQPAPAMPVVTLPENPVLSSLEPDGITLLGNGSQNPGVLPYEPIREEDVLYRQRVWRDIVVKEKMNQHFIAAESGALFYHLLNAVKNDPQVVAYSSLDDRFTTPLKPGELAVLLRGTPIVERVVDWKRDSTGQLFKDTMIVNDFDPATIVKYRLKEDWVFDNKTSRLVVRIIGIAPVQEYTIAPGVTGERTLFWLYYPKLRNTLVQHTAFNNRNYGAGPTWEQVFESRLFSSTIVKSTLDNPSGNYLAAQPGLRYNDMLRLQEAGKIHNAILDYEQHLWSY